MIFHRSACSFLLVLLNTQHHVLADFDSPNFIKGQQSSSTKRDINGRRNMKQDEKGKNDKKNTSTPTYSPSNFPTVTPSIAPYNIITPTMATGPNLSPNCLRNRSSPTPKPSSKPLSFPRTTPFPPPSAKPTALPTPNPTRIPTQNPTNPPIFIDLDTYSPTKDVTFERGDLRKDIRRLGIKGKNYAWTKKINCCATTNTHHLKLSYLLSPVSKGMSVRVVAQANRKLNLGDGNKSTLGFHAAPDGVLTCCCIFGVWWIDLFSLDTHCVFLHHHLYMQVLLSFLCLLDMSTCPIQKFSRMVVVYMVFTLTTKAASLITK